MFTTQVHTDGMGLHNSRLSIHINYQTRQIITLAMNQSIGIVVGIVGNTDGLTHLQSRRKARTPEFIINLNIWECQHTHGNRAFLIVTYSDKIARIRQHTNYITLSNTLVNLSDSTWEHPRMESFETLLLSFTQPYLLHHPFQHLSVHNRPSVPVATTHHRA